MVGVLDGHVDESGLFVQTRKFGIGYQHVVFHRPPGLAVMLVELVPVHGVGDDQAATGPEHSSRDHSSSSRS